MDALDAIDSLVKDFGVPYSGLRSVFEEELDWEQANLKRRGLHRNRYAIAVENTYERLQMWLQPDSNGETVDLSATRFDQANAAKVLDFIGSRRRALIYCTFAVKTGQVKAAAK
jgi:hypothetical protein